MKSLFKFIVLILLLLVTSLNFVSSFGVSIPYSMQDPLRLYSGQSLDIVIGLQSSINEGDLIIVPEILEGKDIVKITDSSKEYNVIANQPVGAAVHLKVSIPDNDNIGKEYTVKLIFKDITKREGGMVGLSTSIGASFNVSVVGKLEEKEKKVKISVWWVLLIVLIAAIVIVSLIVILIIRARKSAKDSENIKKSLGEENEK